MTQNIFQTFFLAGAKVDFWLDRRRGNIGSCRHGILFYTIVFFQEELSGDLPF